MCTTYETFKCLFKLDSRKITDLSPTSTSFFIQSLSELSLLLIITIANPEVPNDPSFGIIHYGMGNHIPRSLWLPLEPCIRYHHILLSWLEVTLCPIETLYLETVGIILPNIALDHPVSPWDTVFSNNRYTIAKYNFWSPCVPWRPCIQLQ